MNFMFSLDQDTVNLIVVIAVVHVVPLLGFMIVTLLMRQLPRFGMGSAWGENARDHKINGF